MPFDPLDFVSLARQLCVSKADEATLRTAVGRMYYGLFLVARGKMRVRRRKAVHTETIRRLRKVKGCRTASDNLDQLFEMRKVADYELVPQDPKYSNWSQNWSRAQWLANHLLPKLQQLK